MNLKTNVHLGTQRNKVVVIDASTDKKWANEYFNTVAEAEQFCKDNGLNITDMNQEPIKVGSKVKFAQELQPGENKFEMTVIEMNGDRCLIETEMDLFVNPRSTVMVKDLIPVPNILKVGDCLLVCLGGKKYSACKDFAACSKAIQEHISLNNFGVSEFYKKKNAGIILHPEKGLIAHVSYNGRVWEGEAGKEITDLTKNDL